MTRWTMHPHPFLLRTSALPLVALPLVIGLLTTLGAVPASAQTKGALSAQLSIQGRKFPEKAAFGQLRITQPPQAQLDGKAARLAPGARIYGTDNLLQLSGTLVGKTLAVAYVKDSYGLVHQIWVLTEAERQAAAAKS